MYLRICKEANGVNH